MVPEEQAPTPSAKSDLPASKGPRRRSRRGGRRHSRRREPVGAAGSQPLPSSQVASNEAAESHEERSQLSDSELEATESAARIEPTEQKLPPLRPAQVVRFREQQRNRESQPPELQKEVLPERDAAPRIRSVSSAIEQVNQIIGELNRALEEMDDVLETLELAERQKIDDERDIENLQRALRRLSRPREEDPRH